MILFIILFGIKQLNKIWKKTFYTFYASWEFENFEFFLTTRQDIINFAKYFAYLTWHGQGLFQTVYFIICWTYFFANITEFQFLQISNLSCIFGHKTWDLEGGSDFRYKK